MAKVPTNLSLFGKPKEILNKVNDPEITKLFNEIMKEKSYNCFICGKPVTLTESHVHHIEKGFCHYECTLKSETTSNKIYETNYISSKSNVGD